MVKEGRAILDVHWKAADDIATAIRSCARKAEEDEKALQIVDDSAILLNAGFPFILTNRKDIAIEAAKDAAARPGGIKSQSIVGTPAVIKHPPKKGGNNAQVD